jgi:hypothetical protein
MKKGFARKCVAICLAAIAIGMPAFAKSKDSKSKDEGYGGVKILKDKKGKVYDLGGMEIIVADWWSPTTPAEPTNAAEEATAEYREWIQKTYNFKIKQVGIDGWGKHPQTFANFASNGGKENYVFILYQSSIAAPLKSGLCYDLSKLDCLDFKQAKWVKQVKDLTTVGKKVYGMRPIAPEPKFGLYFNKRMLQEAGVNPETLYDMQAKGTWTWDAFEKICAKLTRDTNNDGVTDVYALTNFSINFFTAVLASNNAAYVGKDANGKYINTTNTNEFLAAMNWGADLLKKYEMPAPKDAKWDYSYASFRNGEAAMSVCGVYESGNMKNMKDDFGFVCFPKGPKATDYSNVWDDNIYVIPSCYDAERAWKIAFAFNLFSEPTPGYDDSEDWKTAYYNQFRDLRAVDESIARLKKNGVVWYSPLITGLNAGDIIYQVYGGWATPAEQIEKVAPAWQALIDEANGVKK